MKTVEMTREQLNQIEWRLVETEPMFMHIEEPEDGDQGASTVEGQTRLAGKGPEGDELILVINWRADGNPDGTPTGLYDFSEPDVDRESEEIPVYLEHGLFDLRLFDAAFDREPVGEFEAFDALKDVAAANRSLWVQSAKEMLPKKPH